MKAAPLARPPRLALSLALLLGSQTLAQPLVPAPAPKNSRAPVQGNALAQGCLEWVAPRTRWDAAWAKSRGQDVAPPELWRAFRDLQDQVARASAATPRCAQEGRRTLRALLAQSRFAYPDDAQFQSLRGRAHLYFGEPVPAREALTKAAQLEPSQVYANQALAELDRTTHQRDDEVRHLRAAAGSPDALDALDASDVLIAPTVSVATGWATAAEISEWRADAWARLAELSPPELAREAVVAWSKLRPNDPRIPERSAALANEAGNATQLRALLPKLDAASRAYYGARVLYLDSSQSAAAAAAFEAFLKEYPLDLRKGAALRDGARALVRTGHFARARTLFMRAARETGAESADQALFESASPHPRSFDPGSAVAELDQARGVFPQSAQLHRLLIDALAAQDNPAAQRRAESLTDQRLTRDPEDAVALYFKLSLLNRRRAFTRAAPFAEQLRQRLRAKALIRPFAEPVQAWAQIIANSGARGLGDEAKSLQAEAERSGVLFGDAGRVPASAATAPGPVADPATDRAAAAATSSAVPALPPVNLETREGFASPSADDSLAN